MTNSHRILAGTVLAGGLLMSGLVAAPASATEPAATAAEGCTVTSGTLTWGVKESFRSYISSSIAQGEWTVTDGATYTTPVFTFEGATGQLDPETGAGTIAFPGAVHFTGHGGLLDMTLAAPSIVIADDGSATLHLDARSTDTAGEPAVDEKQAEIGVLGAPVIVDVEAGTATAQDNPVALTATGAPAFGGFYQAGDQLDPVVIDVQLDCETPTPSPTEKADPTEKPTPDQSVPAEAPGETANAWVPFVVGGGIVVAAGGTAAILFARRKR